VRFALEQVGDVEQFKEVITIQRGGILRGAAFDAVIKVGLHAQVRKQASLLKDITDVSVLTGQIPTVAEPGLAVNFDMTLYVFFQPGETP
jgi:hypothetical protein